MWGSWQENLDELRDLRDEAGVILDLEADEVQAGIDDAVETFLTDPTAAEVLLDEAIELYHDIEDKMEYYNDGTVCPMYYVDVDKDGYGDEGEFPETHCFVADEGWVQDSSDCFDGNDDIYPGAAEICDGKDKDCDGEVDPDC